MYPSIPKRIKAAAIDSIIILISVVLLMTAYYYTGVESPIIGVLAFSIFLLYEPILVSWKGRTLGHKLFNFRVIDVETISNIGFIKAVGRYLIKSFLGIFSLFWALFTNRQQSLHDLATNSAVISADVETESLKENGLPEIPFSSEQDNVLQVSITRRVIISLIWFVAFFVVVSIIYGVFIPAECLEDSGKRISLCRHSEDFLGYVYLGVFITCLVLGSKGKLIGAKRKIIQCDTKIYHESQSQTNGSS